MATKKTTFMEMVKETKTKHPDALVLFRKGDYYEAYDDDAQVCGGILGITISRNFKEKGADGHGLRTASFPQKQLDIYLPKLVRAGKRVAIKDDADDNIVSSSLQEEKEPEKEMTITAETSQQLIKSTMDSVKNEVLDILYGEADYHLPQELESKLSEYFGILSIIRCKYRYHIPLNNNEISWLVEHVN